MSLSRNQIEKVKNGILVLCPCGNTHAGRHLKCRGCLTSNCKKCGNPFIKGGKDYCSACIKKRKE